MAKTAPLAKPDAPAKPARTGKTRKAAARKPAKDAAPKPRAKKAVTSETSSPAKAPPKTKPIVKIDARRLALAAEFRAEIELYTSAFNESLDCAIDRLVAEHDELDRIVGEILALAAQAKELAQAA